MQDANETLLNSVGHSPAPPVFCLECQHPLNVGNLLMQKWAVAVQTITACKKIVHLCDELVTHELHGSVKMSPKINASQQQARLSLATNWSFKSHANAVSALFNSV